jgi:multisubunit Na+/H+ antiporter MnhG subunit
MQDGLSANRYTSSTVIASGIHRIGLAINHLENIHWANVHTFLVAIALVLINCYFPHVLATSLSTQS